MSSEIKVGSVVEILKGNYAGSYAVVQACGGTVAEVAIISSDPEIPVTIEDIDGPIEDLRLVTIEEWAFTDPAGTNWVVLQYDKHFSLLNLDTMTTYSLTTTNDTYGVMQRMFDIANYYVDKIVPCPHALHAHLLRHRTLNDGDRMTVGQMQKEVDAACNMTRAKTAREFIKKVDSSIEKCIRDAEILDDYKINAGRDGRFILLQKGNCVWLFSYKGGCFACRANRHLVCDLIGAMRPCPYETWKPYFSEYSTRDMEGRNAFSIDEYREMVRNHNNV